jgi:hypothetical protein
MHLNCRNCHPSPGSTTMVRWRVNCLAPYSDRHGALRYAGACRSRLPLFVLSSGASNRRAILCALPLRSAELLKSLALLHSWTRAVSSAMAPALQTPIGSRAPMSIASSVAPRRRSFRFNCRPNLRWLSTPRPPKRLPRLGEAVRHARTIFRDAVFLPSSKTRLVWNWTAWGQTLGRPIRPPCCPG